jgi:hypothetical protein
MPSHAHARLHMKQEGREIRAGERRRAGGAQDLHRLSDEKFPVRPGPRRPSAAVDFNPRNASVLVGRERRRQSDPILYFNVVVGQDGNREPVVDVAEVLLERRAGRPANHIRATGANSAIVIETDDARISERTELDCGARHPARLLEGAVAWKVGPRRRRRPAREAAVKRQQPDDEIEVVIGQPAANPIVWIWEIAVEPQARGFDGTGSERAVMAPVAISAATTLRRTKSTVSGLASPFKFGSPPGNSLMIPPSLAMSGPDTANSAAGTAPRICLHRAVCPLLNVRILGKAQ